MGITHGYTDDQRQLIAQRIEIFAMRIAYANSLLITAQARVNEGHIQMAFDTFKQAYTELKGFYT